MKQQNKYRSEKENVQLLEKALSLKDRLFSLLALKRGARRLRKWLLILLIAAPVIWGTYHLINYALEKAYGLSIDNVSYVSRHGIISREQVMQILEIEGTINMATLNVGEMKEKLETHPCISAAVIRAEMPDTLHIEITERIPVVYVEKESATETGDSNRLFMDPDGYLFPVEEKYHRNFLNVPTWYLQPEDINEIKAGAVINAENCRPIKELISASNAYNLVEIPSITEIFRPRPWKMVIILDGGTEVMMQVYDIQEQLVRLQWILEHARVSGKRLRSVNVIPANNPAVIYVDEDDGAESRDSRRKP